MPTLLSKKVLIDDIRAVQVEPLVDLVLGDADSQSILSTWWTALNISIASLELAYRRGYQAGYEDSTEGKEYREYNFQPRKGE